MRKIFFLVVLGLFLNSCSKEDVVEDVVNIPEPVFGVVKRSSFEKIDDIIEDLQEDGEKNGTVFYEIESGNTDGYFKINSATGVISIAKEIVDENGIVRSDKLIVNATQLDVNKNKTSVVNKHYIEVVDGYDHTLNNLSDGFVYMDLHNETYPAKGVVSTNPWTVYNNVWGANQQGLQMDVDYRIGMIYNPKTYPAGTIFMWETPGTVYNTALSKGIITSGTPKSSVASVWSYCNLFVGNRKNLREDVVGYPFKVKDLTKLNFTVDFEQLYGDDDYKVALNSFLTDEATLVPFNQNDGDFFMVFDQHGTFIPKYPNDLGDENILGAPFTWLHDMGLYQGNANYRWRRVIIKNDQKLTKGTVDLKYILDRFATANYLDKNQSIYHFQMGMEVTSGFGALRFNQLALEK